MKIATVTHVSDAPVEQEIKGKVEKKSGKRVGYNYIIIKSYKESQKNDVVKCLYIKSLTNFGFCVIKEGTYGDTKDKQGRDIIDRLKWQKQLHELLQDKVRMPRLLGTFEENGNYYLVIEHIRGKPLQKICSEWRKELRQSIITGGKKGMKVLDYLIQIADILDILHSQQVVHRDATPNNYMITPGGKVALIDMEMCYSVKEQFPTPAFQLGTYGYMSPQQEVTETPTTAEDIYALGAIMLQVWTGISPLKFTNESLESLSRKVHFLVTDQEIGELIIRCMQPDATVRPSAKVVRRTLQQYKTDIRYDVSRHSSSSVFYDREDILSIVQQSIRTMISPLMADPEKGWFAENMKPTPDMDKHKLSKMWYASFNRGDSGIIYMISQAKYVGLDVQTALPFVQLGLERIREKYINRIESANTGLHFGSDGIAASLATAIRNKLVEPSPEYLDWIDQLLARTSDSLGILSGVAGQGIANLIAKPLCSSQKIQERIEQYVRFLLEKQEYDGYWIFGNYQQKITKRKMNKITRGFVEGMAGILYFLLEYGHSYNDETSTKSAIRGMQWLMKKAIHKNGGIWWNSSKGKELSYWWTGGASGIALSFMKAWQITNEPVYKQYAVSALKNIPGEIIDNNLGQSYGLSGVGEAYLEAWRVFKDEEWLHRAGWISQIIMQLQKQDEKSGPYWLVEHERHPTASFMTGNSGVLHFLLRYCYPDVIGFPMLI